MNSNPDKVFLIVGLGNPGSRYENTRHNVGIMAIDLWSRALRVSLSSRGFQSRNAHVILKNKKVMLLCPLTFMNQSGKSVNACADYFGIEPANILVVHDDIDLPLGRVKVVRKSGAGGHKGVQSIIDLLGSEEFSRVKIGIGRGRHGEPVEDYVLSPFYHDQKDIVEQVLHMSIEACKLFVSEGVETAMNQINCQNLLKKEEGN